MFNSKQLIDSIIRDKKPKLFNDRIDLKEMLYEPNYINALIEQYKLYISRHKDLKALRETTNRYFFTLHTFVITGIVVLYLRGDSDFLLLSGLLSIIGILLCYLGIRLLIAYINHSCIFYVLVREIEKKLPLLGFEWEYIILNELEKRKRNIPLYMVMGIIIAIFLVAYFIFYTLIVNSIS